MRRPVRLGLAISAAALPIAVMVAAPAGATTTAAPETAQGSYQLTASTTGLSLDLAGQFNLTIDTTSASTSSNGPTTASGYGIESPSAVGNSTATAGAVGAPAVTDPTGGGQNCAGSIPSPVSELLSLGLLCSDATASIANAPASDTIDAKTGLPSATADANIVNITVLGLLGSAGDSLGSIGTLGSTLTGTLNSLLSLGGGAGLPTGAVANANNTSDPLGSLLSTLGDITADASNLALAKITVGASSSSVAVTPTAATATTTQSLADVQVLPGVGANGAPLIDVSVLPSTSTTVLDRTTGMVTSTENAPLLCISIDGTSVCGPQIATIPVQPLLTLSLATGTANSGGGATGGSASTVGVGLNLLDGLIPGGQGIDLGVAEGGASAQGVPTGTTAAGYTVSGGTPAAVQAATNPPAGNAAVPGVTAVHTGEPWAGSTPVVLLAIASGLGLIARRRVLGAAHHVFHAVRFATPFGGRHSSGPVAGTSSVSPPVPAPDSTHFDR